MMVDPLAFKGAPSFAGGDTSPVSPPSEGSTGVAGEGGAPSVACGDTSPNVASLLGEETVASLLGEETVASLLGEETL